MNFVFFVSFFLLNKHTRNQRRWLSITFVIHHIIFDGSPQKDLSIYILIIMVHLPTNVVI
jgi:hypothetical protein